MKIVLGWLPQNLTHLNSVQTLVIIGELESDRLFEKDIMHYKPNLLIR